MDKHDEFESFLKNVDEISGLVKDLNSSDVEIRQKAMEEADCYIAALDKSSRTQVNKTTINIRPPLQPSSSPQSECPASFMKMIENDAEDRRLRRVAKEKKALALKGKGNEAYAQEDYETAVKYYSDGMAELRDMLQLYTNRAQAYIKLGKYKEAIGDCERALKCNERCTKAYLHMGKAHLELREYNESRHCFEKIVEIEPGRETMMKEYLTRVDLEEKRETQEMNAKQEFDKGEGKGTAVPQLLEKLSRPGQIPLFYCGGLQILLETVIDLPFSWKGQSLHNLQAKGSQQG
ncbi:tetratricopeptide repeat protein 12 [Solea senegalensis]|uniref:Tetratricopeptide repeat protein 12 n=1 Tax=Solea senegalensis TaxID=28829 RepID=A0AAV6PZL0_SOLSE|nr:tetratricopeptide repeat protein 12-like isoform X2 [Solea senegalensis]KAG7479673.1 tetratricopeptide repeat protein 12 [Solea senegalensis]